MKTKLKEAFFQMNWKSAFQTSWYSVILILVGFLVQVGNFSPDKIVKALLTLMFIISVIWLSPIIGVFVATYNTLQLTADEDEDLSYSKEDYIKTRDLMGNELSTLGYSVIHSNFINLAAKASNSFVTFGFFAFNKACFCLFYQNQGQYGFTLVSETNKTPEEVSSMVEEISFQTEIRVVTTQYPSRTTFFVECKNIELNQTSSVISQLLAFSNPKFIDVDGALALMQLPLFLKDSPWYKELTDTISITASVQDSFSQLNQTGPQGSVLLH